ncbi:hypothetical protein [Nocardia sp. NPDC004260]
MEDTDCDAEGSAPQLAEIEGGVMAADKSEVGVVAIELGVDLVDCEALTESAAPRIEAPLVLSTRVRDSVNPFRLSPCM